MIDITIDDVIEVIAGSLSLLIDDEIIRANINRVPPPLDSFILLTEIGIYDLSTPKIELNRNNNSSNISTNTRIDIQIDFYGPRAGDKCKAIKTFIRSSYGYNSMPYNINPLFCSDGIQSPLISGEQQYVTRWILTASFQYNPSIDVPQYYSESIIPYIHNINEIY